MDTTAPLSLPPELLFHQIIPYAAADSVARHNLFHTCVAARRIILALDRPDWAPYAAFIKRIPKMIYAITHRYPPDPAAVEEATSCHAKLCELTELKASFFTKEARFFKTLFSLSPRVFHVCIYPFQEYSGYHQISEDRFDPVPTTAYDCWDNERCKIACRERCKIWAKRGNIALPRIIAHRCINPSLFIAQFAKALANECDMEHALEVFRSIPPTPQLAEAFEALCEGYAKSNQLNKVMPLVQEFAELSKDPHNAKFFVQLVIFLMNHGHFTEAAEVSALIQDEPARFLSRGHICTIYFLKGLNREGFDFLRTLIRGKEWDSLRALILELVRNNLDRAALQITELIQKEYPLQKILEDSLAASFSVYNAPDFKSREEGFDRTPINYLSLVLDMHVKQERLEEAFSLAITLGEKFKRNNLLFDSDLAKFGEVLIKRGLLDQAENIFKLLSRASIGGYYLGIIQGKRRALEDKAL